MGVFILREWYVGCREHEFLEHTVSTLAGISRFFAEINDKQDELDHLRHFWGFFHIFQ